MTTRQGETAGRQDRRKRVERRIPEPVEIEFSEAEWALYFINRATQTTAPEQIVTDIFETVRY